ncbi:MAG: iron-sulfur cluster repair di-iron protein [Candidatus Obscuribacterales bacterium]
MITQAFRDKTVGSLLAEQPTRAAVFDKYKIDFCCGGGKSLAEACQARGADVDAVISELLQADQQVEAEVEPPEVWLDKSITELADHIEQVHHRFLKQELPRLQFLAEKVARVHGEAHPEMIDLAHVFIALKEEMETHTMKEERILFPYLRALDRGERTASCFGSVANPIKQMEFEHAEAGDALEQMRQLTNEYTVPEGACNSWRALVDGLSRMDGDLRVHVHKENSILFPKALELERGLSALA